MWVVQLIIWNQLPLNCRGFLQDQLLLACVEFNVHGSVHREYIPIYIQQDATLHSLFISGNCSTCFGWYLHPSSVTHTTVSTTSGTCQTVTATCHYRGRVGTALQLLLPATIMEELELQSSSNSSTIVAGSSNGLTSARCCRYSCMRSWWWVEISPETCRAVSRYK